MKLEDQEQVGTHTILSKTLTTKIEKIKWFINRMAPFTFWVRTVRSSTSRRKRRINSNK